MKTNLTLALAMGLTLVGCVGSTQPNVEEPTSPAVPDAEEAVHRAELARSEHCDAPMDATTPPSRAWPLGDDGSWIVHIVCFVAAYQPNARLVVVHADGEVLPLALPIVDDAGALSSTREVANVEVEGEVLTETSLDRGLGDCGRQVRARLVAPSRLVFVEHRQRACDDGEPVVDRDQWPTRSVVASE
ncbi:MAG: hypothetical protein J0L92_35695 [Deltaproteobacteria bacterium]|nr:hypothetical protein [Deltaproteobacteria bacterium]